MADAALSPLSAWESFYVIVGSSGGALTGLQLVVIALVADQRRPSTGREINAFGTPTGVHLGVVILISAMLSARWPPLLGTALGPGMCGLAGLIYAAIVVRRARQTTYEPVAEDWLWHPVFPIIASGTLVAAAALLHQRSEPALFAVEAASLLLLFIGIHNAWDSVQYIAIEGGSRGSRRDGERGQGPDRAAR
ncbi:MAG: hypothetical protein ABI647_18975 [Gemmatimonadota bacterium]